MYGQNTIEDVWTFELAAPQKNSIATAMTKFSESRALLVVVELRDGSFGIGEAGTGHTGQASRTIPALRALIEGPYKSMLIGQPLNVTGLRRKLESAFKLEFRGIGAAAMSGIDIALWDLFAKTLDRPLCEVLGGGSRPVIVYATGGHYRDAADGWSLEEEMRSYVDAGFNSVKMKVGGASARVDFERVSAVRAAIGSHIGLAADASYAMTPKQAVAFSSQIEPLGIDFFEAPVALNNVAGLAEVRERSPLPIAGNELASTLMAFKEYVLGGCLDYVQPSLSMCGGITEAIRIAALASAFSLPVTLQSSGSSVATLASAHFAAAIPDVHSFELNQVHKGLTGQLHEEPLTLVDGRVAPPTAPGLGVTASLAELRAFRAVERAL
ncbi:MAG TPA: mandelate racemase/muconate lactonizing enzyme family protein [Bryobacteraceae bacterium]|jgi:L-alanine-DL-glutamate epimerase and related enzymes of enolase superfamily|nr:mandelate racemase/muconate lactonizing enzyme family protein [Bryobacteraceae bacterium]